MLLPGGMLEDYSPGRCFGRPWKGPDLPGAYLRVARSHKVPARFLPAGARLAQGFVHVPKLARQWALRKDDINLAPIHW